MSARGSPLWVAGLATWVAVAALLGVILSLGEPRCDHDAIAGAIAWAGVPAIALIGADLVRRPRMSVVLLLAWAIVFWLGTWGTAASDWGDCDQLVGVFLWATIPAAMAAPVVGIGYFFWWLVGASHDPRPRKPPRWRFDVKGSSLIVARRKRPRG